MKARAGGSRLGQLPWGTSEGDSLAKKPVWAGEGAAQGGQARAAGSERGPGESEGGREEPLWKSPPPGPALWVTVP